VRLARFTDAAGTRLGIVTEDATEILDVGAADPDLPTEVGALLRMQGGVELAGALAGSARRVDLAAVRLEAPVATPPAILAVGLNYGKHVAEMGHASRPDHPVIFNKQITALAGPFDDVHVPAAAPTQVDYEGELALVIARDCRAVPAANAPQVVAGYMIMNDVSVRDWQHATPTLTMGKSWDTHAPCGPWMVTADELTDPHGLGLRTWVDDELRQDGNTADLLTNCWDLIAYLSTAFTLRAGTIISTGTPDGVGWAMEPKGFVRPGQTVRIEIERIGAIANRYVAEPAGLARW
jgi:2-keto-4-pentenoate hydratase/2-oxohepta-3-ene-1,7-dioic acid hydratase in catechol pathway